MPASSALPTAIDRQLLLQLGERLRRARQKQGLTTTQMAERAGLSRMTLSAVEAGEPTPTMGSYLRVMSGLGLSGELALLANEATPAPATGRDAAQPTGPAMLAVRDARHELQDLQSLLLHEEAVRLMQRQPALIQQALDTLERWRSAGSSHSRFLWDEWSVILHRRQWRRALSRTRRSMELRQASPLPTVLPPEVRQRILDDVQRLKAGVAVAETPPPGSRRPPRER
jgi:transcriptional regulator with XRE-family HTH domain